MIRQPQFPTPKGLTTKSLLAAATLALGFATAHAQVWVQMAPKGPATGPATTTSRPAPVLAAKIDNIAWPAKITAVDYAALQTAALAQKIDVSYRRASVAEVVEDLETRTDLRVAFPASLGPEWSFTLEAKAVPVKDILEKLAADGKFDLAFRPATAVLTQKADDAILSALEKQLASPDRWLRCQGVWDLGSLADPRIYPSLIKALADKDAGVVNWTLQALEKHARMGLLLPEDQKDTLVTALTAWLKTYQSQDESKIMGRLGLGMWGIGGLGWRPGFTFRATNNRMELLASTARPQAVAALLDTIQSATFAPARREAANALADNELAAADLAQALVRVEAEIVRDQAEYDRITAEMNKDRDPNGLMVFTGSSPNAQAHAALMAATGLRRELIIALLTLRAPEFIQTAQDLTNKTARSDSDTWLITNLPPDERRLLNLGAVVERDLKTLREIYDVKDPVVQPTLGGAWGGPHTPFNVAFRAAYPATALASISDPAITAEFIKIIKDDKAYDALAQATLYSSFAFPVTDANLVAALLPRATRTGAGGKLALRSLGHSHDPAVADALIKMLKDPDPEMAANAGLALAGTRDPRALPLLVALLQEKRDWPDFEAEDQADLKAGKGIRPRVNPRKALVAALLELRDPQAFTELANFAFNDKLDKEIPETARCYLQSAVASAADMDRLVALTQKASAAIERDILRGTANSPWLAWGMTPIKPSSFRCTTDARWFKLLADRVDDDESFIMNGGRRGPPVPQGNSMINALADFKTPHAEKAILDLCKFDDEEVAYFAGLALEKFQDPQIEVQFKH